MPVEKKTFLEECFSINLANNKVASEKEHIEINSKDFYLQQFLIPSKFSEKAFILQFE